MKNLKQRVDNLKKLKILDQSIILNDNGYNSFLKSKKNMVSLFAAAISLDKESIVPKVGIVLNKFLNAIILYIQSQCLSTKDVQTFCTNHRYIIKRIDLLVERIRKKNYHYLKNILKWIIFNLKIQCLFKEIDLITLEDESNNTKYLLNEINSLAFLFKSKNLKNYNIVSIDEFEEELRIKILTIDEEILNMIID